LQQLVGENGCSSISNSIFAQSVVDCDFINFLKAFLLHLGLYLVAATQLQNAASTTAPTTTFLPSLTN